jgi:DNA repair protein RecO (recombination protein O)
MSTIKTKALVIKETNVGEADRIITLFSEKEGKIQASATGVRRTKSTLSPGTQFLCYGNFVLYKGKSLYRVNQCDIIENFFGIRNSIEKLSYASYFCELASETIGENYPNNELLKFLLNTLYYLTNDLMEEALLKAVYELRLMSIIGYTPNLLGCNKCGNEEKDMYFNSEIGGLLCNKCINQTIPQNSLIVHEPTIYAMKYIIYSRPKKVFSFQVSGKVLKELETIISDFVITHIGKKFKSLEYLNRILNKE